MNCKEGVIQLLDQITNIIQVIPDQDYPQQMEIFNNSTLGKHFRHIYDFFNCLINQCNCDEVDYAKRQRDAMIESDPSYAISHFEGLKEDISNLNEDLDIEVYTDFELPDGQRPKVRSTIGRELMYAYDHAVHHLAIVKIGLKIVHPDLPLSKDVGVAASTIKHQYEVSHGH